jgi:hypothetical protein
VGQLGDTLEGLANSDDPPERWLRAALLSLVTIGRTRPHLYRLVFTTPTGDPTAAVLAAERTWDLFLDSVGRVVGPEQARRYGALLLTNAHGIAGLESSGHLVWDKWHITAEELIDTIVSLLPTAPELRRVATVGTARPLASRLGILVGDAPQSIGQDGNHALVVGEVSFGSDELGVTVQPLR